MGFLIEVVERKATPVLSVRRHSAVENLPAVLGPAYGEIVQYANTQDIVIPGPAFVTYYNMDMTNLDLEIGFITSEPVAGNDDIRGTEIPAGKYVTATHIGSYTQMVALYEAMMAFMTEKELTPSGIAIEFYYNSPMEVPESELKTEVLMGICEG